MPIYEYLCEGCSYKFEVKQSMKDEPLVTCERCGKPVKRLISSPAIMFKGSGWYVTDYSDKLKPPSNGEQTPSTTAEKKDEKSGDTSAPTPAPAASSTPTTAPASTPVSSPNPSTPPPTSDK